MNAPAAPHVIDEADRALIRATQAGLPLVPRPYEAVAEAVGLSPEETMRRLRRRTRRFGSIAALTARGHPAADARLPCIPFR